MTDAAEHVHQDGYDKDPWWLHRCRTIDARVRDDIQALLITAEDMLREWAKDGLLDRNIPQRRWNADERQWELRRMRVTDTQALEFHLACIKDTLNDARSLIAIEAEEVARGDQ